MKKLLLIFLLSCGLNINAQNILFQDTFQDNILSALWDLESDGKGVYFGLDSNEVYIEARHKATIVQKVVDNNITTKQRFESDTLVLIVNYKVANLGTNINAQFEVGLAISDDTRIYYGNNSGDKKLFARIKVNGVNEYSKTNIAESNDIWFKIKWEQSGEEVVFSSWGGSSWTTISAVDVSSYSFSANNPVILYGVGGESNNRTGGDWGSIGAVYLLDRDISTKTP